MSTRKTILVHGVLAAGTLAVVGYLFAQVAGMWVASQSDAGRGATDTGAIVSALAWRLPFTMAAIGFAFVALGEGLKSLWKSPPKREEPTLAEVEMQRLLGEQETLPETGEPAAMLGR